MGTKVLYWRIRMQGGAKLYTLSQHGNSNEMDMRAGSLMTVEHNHSPVRIYGFHCQHYDCDQGLMLQNASNVAMYGSKTELANSFVRCNNSRNVHLFGLGGATNPVTGHTYFYFQDCADYVATNVFDQAYDKKDMIWYGNRRPQGAIQSACNIFDTYNAVEEVHEGQFFAPAKCERPVFYKRGQPWDILEWRDSVVPGASGTQGGARQRLEAGRTNR
jgi:hypothetical protein